MTAVMETLPLSANYTHGQLSAPLRRIVDHALSWRESAVYPQSAGDAEETGAAEKLLERWEKLFLLGPGEEAFKNRLEQLGWSREQAFAHLLPIVSPDEAPAPEWAAALEMVLDLAASREAEAIAEVAYAERLAGGAVSLYESEFTAPGQEWIVFEAFLRPFVAYALRELRRHAVWDTRLTEKARQDIAGALLGRMSWHCTRTIAYEMKRARVRGELWGASPEERYTQYIDELLPARRTTLFAQYPMLARLCTGLMLNFMRCTEEFLDRYEADAEQVAELLGIESTTLVERVSPFLSDPHHNGRAVWRATFAKGDVRCAVYYKPRSLAVDVAWSDLLSWLTQHGLEPQLVPTEVLDRGSYGWARGVEPADCADESEVALYMRRQGVMSALVVALAGQDFHPENFAAAGSMPVAVDLEGLLAATVSARFNTLAELPHAATPLQFTAAGNLMLPYLRAGEPDQPLFCSSGITGSGARVWPIKLPKWANVHTDQLSLSFQWIEMRSDNSVPTLGGQKLDVMPYKQDVVEGLTRTFRFLEQHWGALLAEDGPLPSFRGLKSRTVFRDTQEYADLLFWTTAPDILRSGAAYEVALEVLAARPPVFCNGAYFPDLVEKEKESLWQRDVPIAVTPNDCTEMFLADGTSFGPTVPMPAWEQLLLRGSEWSATETDWQAGVTKAMLSFAEEREALPTDDLLAAATAIGDALLDTAVLFGNEVAWLTLHRGAGSQRVYALQTNAWDLNGTAGAALFLAELARVGGEERFAAMAKRALASAQRTLVSLRKTSWVEIIGLSGFCGHFALVYALTRAGVALEDDSMLDAALAVALMPTEGELWANDNPDFLLGHAGALATLAALYKVRPDERLRKQAGICFEVIEGAACNGGEDGWQVKLFERPLLGMGHGSAGIASALLLAESMLERDAMPAVRAAFAHERRHFDARQKRWPNLQRTDGHTMHGWCSGQAGIGLSRLLALRLGGDRLGSDRAAVEAELNVALAAATEEMHTLRQHACCGDSGVLVLGSTTARALGRPELLRQTHAAATAMLERARDHRAWRLQEFTERMPIPGVLNGVSGIGLALLTVLDSKTSEFLTLC